MGKMMVVKCFVWYSGLDYVVMMGGDVVFFGVNVVTKFYEMFDWAFISRKGLFLFIDEVDVFLVKWGSDVVGMEFCVVFNVLLYCIGEMNCDVVLVLATNRSEDLDKAVFDCMDEFVEIGLLDFEVWKWMVKLYFDKFIVWGVDVGDDKFVKFFFGGLFCRSFFERFIEVKDVIDVDLDVGVVKMEGFSGCEILKFMVSV